MSSPVRVIVFKDGDIFVAQCLEVDIAAQGATEAEAGIRLQAAFAAEQEEARISGRNFMDIGPAPAVFQSAYDIDVVSKTQLQAA